MSTKLQFPLGSQLAFELSFGRDITGADLSAVLSLFPVPSAAGVLAASDDDTPQITIVATDLVAGDCLLTIKPGATSELKWPFARWQAKATLTSGEVVVLPEHQGPVVLTPIPVGLTEPYEDGVVETITPDSGSIGSTASDSTNVINRRDLTGLGVSTAGSTKLSGLSAVILAAWTDGVIVRLTLTGDISVDYRLVTGTVGTESQFRIACDNAAGRYWQLATNPSKQGVPTVWDPALSKFKQILTAGGAIALADDADAFVIPD